MKKCLIIFFILIFTLPVFAKNTILIMGDSLSAAYGFSQNQSWVHGLQKKLDENDYHYQVINASIAGDTTSNGLARLPKALLDYQPYLTLIALGGNDGLRGISLLTIKQNLQSMITQIKKAGSLVLLAGIRLPPNLGPAYTQQFYQIYVDLAEENDISFIPLFLKGVDDQPTLMQTDGIHPTVQAQSVILETVWGEMVKILAR